MKILLTGFNPSQTTRNYHLHSSKLHIVPWHYSLYNCLVDMGHEVEQRSIPLGEAVRPLSYQSTYNELNTMLCDEHDRYDPSPYVDASQYDEVILFLGSPTQRVSSKFYEGLWTISQFPNCILAFDDWQIKKQWRGIESLAASASASASGNKQNGGGGDLEDKLFGRFVLERVNKKTIEQVKPYEKELKKGLDVILKKRNRVIVPGFAVRHLFSRSSASSSSVDVVLGGKRSEEELREEFGAHLLFGEEVGYPRNRIFVVNPNPYHLNRTWEDPGHEGEESLEWRRSCARYSREGKEVEERPKKRRRLNFASLAHSMTRNWLKKQCGVPKRKIKPKAATVANDPSAAVADNQHLELGTNDSIPSHIGTWPLDLYGDRLDPEKRLPEDEMIKVFAQDWACLMPKYEHAGSGWWRARPLQCADAGSILVADDKELAALYGWQYPFFGRTASDIVKLSDSELEDMASIQEWLLYAMHPLDKRVQRAEVSAVLHAPK
ncbi:hypothetical protein CKM354_001210400 [Cercospora kikuchii]|uniref:Uncharacterized protein n=1 Tax=Cercospora kikuchii TaxID=84275 RepID=A0A9P3FLA5_9PEZI|nr:uncharacterized protein CKM354_001210400 [Cercospora kikuchii]GIZ49064.1 hypothetical protein CKM354_001210400 [Cercospora kikuchii]